MVSDRARSVLVYRVTKFARRHQIPVHRSVFTYCEDEVPMGLDLGKEKYGGPFTTEQLGGGCQSILRNTQSAVQFGGCLFLGLCSRLNVVTVHTSHGKKEFFFYL